MSPFSSSSPLSAYSSSSPSQVTSPEDFRSETLSIVQMDSPISTARKRQRHDKERNFWRDRRHRASTPETIRVEMSPTNVRDGSMSEFAENDEVERPRRHDDAENDTIRRDLDEQLSATPSNPATDINDTPATKPTNAQAASTPSTEFTESTIISLLQSLYELPIRYQQRGMKFPSSTYFLQHFESTYDGYHKNPLVQTLFTAVLQEFEQEIEACEIPVHPDASRTTASVDKCISTEKWKAFIVRNRLRLETLVKQISKNHNKVMVKSNSEARLKSIDSTISTAESAEWDFLNSYGADIMDTRMVSNQELREWAQNLLPSKPVETRRAAMDSFMSIYVGDLVTREPWKTVIDCFAVALSDVDDYISSNALDLCQKMYSFGHAEAVIYLHLGVIRYLNAIFSSKSPIAYALDIGDDLFQKTMRYFRLLHYWQLDAPTHWNGFSDHLSVEFFDKTFELYGLQVMSVFEFCESTSQDEGVVTPLQCSLVYVALLDPTAEWFRIWNREHRIRKYLIQGKHQLLFLQQLMNVLNHVHQEVQRAVGGMRYFAGLLADNYRYLLLVHAVSVLGSLMCTHEGAEVVESDRTLMDMIGMLCAVCRVSDEEMSLNSTQNRRLTNLVSILKDTIHEIASSLRVSFGDVFKHSHIVQLLHPLSSATEMSSRGKPTLNKQHAHIDSTVQVFASISQILRALLKNPRPCALFFIDATRSQCTLVLLQLLRFCEGLFNLTTTAQNRELKMNYFELVQEMALHAEFNSILCGNAVTFVDGDAPVAAPSLDSSATIADTTTPTTTHKFNFVQIIGQQFDDPNLPQEQMLDILVSFASYTSGLREIRHLSLHSTCVEHLMERFYLEPSNENPCSIHSLLYYLFCQFCCLSSGLKTCLERNFIQDLCEDFIQRSKENFDWIPHDEVLHSDTVPQMGTELFGLLLNLPHFVVTLTGSKHSQTPNMDSSYDFVGSTNRTIDMLMKHLIINETETHSDEICMRGLQVLESMIDHLNSCVVLEHKYKFVQYLCDKQVAVSLRGEPVEGAPQQESQESAPPVAQKQVPFKDECLLMRNRILIKLYTLGGNDEKQTPPVPSNMLQSPNPHNPSYAKWCSLVVSSIDAVQVYTKETLHRCMHESPAQPLTKSEKDLLKSLKDTPVDTLTLHALQQLFRIPRERFLGTLASRQRILRHMLTLPSALLAPPTGYKLIKFAVTRPATCAVGDRMVMRFAKYLQIQNADTFDKDACEKLRTALNISVHECLDLSGKPLRKTSNYDWFAAVCLLLFQNADMAFTFLSKFAKRPEAYYLWFEKSRTITYPDTTQLLHPVLIISELAEYILRIEHESSFQFFQLQGFSPLPLVIDMMSQFFLNWLNFDGICNVLMLTLLKGIDWIVYVVVCCLHHICEMTMDRTDPCWNLRQFAQWKRNFSALEGFDLERCVERIEAMEQKYRSMCLAKMALVGGDVKRGDGKSGAK